MAFNGKQIEQFAAQARKPWGAAWKRLSEDQKAGAGAQIVVDVLLSQCTDLLPPEAAARIEALQEMARGVMAEVVPEDEGE